MNIECDRCKKIYNDYQDTQINFNLRYFGENNNFHICFECAEILRDFIEENIPLKHMGEHQSNREKEKRITNEYYKSLEESK